LHVIGSEEALCPRGLGALNRVLLVIHEVVSEDLSFSGVGGDDLPAAMDDAVGLIKVHGLGDIVWNDGIVLPNFGDAIDLHGEENRDALAAEVAGEQHGSRGSPAVAEQNDTGASFFFRGKNAIAIGIEQAEDSGVSLLPAAVLENLDISIFGNGSFDQFGELNWAVVRVVVGDETSDETDYDVGRRRGWLGLER